MDMCNMKIVYIQNTWPTESDTIIRYFSTTINLNKLKYM